MESDAFKKRDKASYDELPARYIDYVNRVSHFIVDQIAVQAELRPGDEVLDIGSGVGTAASQAARLVCPGGSVTGIDYSEGLVEIANQSAANGLPPDCRPPQYLWMDAENLEFEDNSFDVVINFSAIFHFPDPMKAVKEMVRVLKPGGRFVLSYTSVQPTALTARIKHLLSRGLRRVASPITPYLEAPVSLNSVANDYLPTLAGPVEPEWSKGDPGGHIRGFMATAGLRDPKQTWVGRDVYFNRAEEFYEAQLMISSAIRVRLLDASEDAKQSLRRDYVAMANRVLSQGGMLIYRFGAVVISDRKPSA